MEKLQFAPLPSTFMLIAIVGFLTSVILIYPYVPSWGFAFALVFIFMFAASLISMTHAPIGPELSVHTIKNVKQNKKKK